MQDREDNFKSKVLTAAKNYRIKTIGEELASPIVPGGKARYIGIDAAGEKKRKFTSDCFFFSF